MEKIKRNGFITSLFIILSGLVWAPAHAQLRVGDILAKERMEALKDMFSPEFPATADNPRLYILDFWSKTCGGCIATFPKMEGLQYQFRKHIKIVTINPFNDEKEAMDNIVRQQNAQKRWAEQKYASDSTWQGGYRDYRMTTLPASFGDSTWLDLFTIEGVPHIVWLDGTGQILAVTSSSSVNAHNIEDFLRRQEVPKMALKGETWYYDLSSNNLVDLWGEAVFPYHNGNMYVREYSDGHHSQYRLVVDSARSTLRYSFINKSITELYKFVWQVSSPEQWQRPEYVYSVGTVKMDSEGDTVKALQFPPDNRLLWEVSIPEYYTGPIAYNYSQYLPGRDAWKFRAQFCVEFVLPLERQHEAPRLLLEGLNHYFAQRLGINGHFESRNRYCLILKKDKTYRPLTSTAGAISAKYDPRKQMEQYVNYPFEHILHDFICYRLDHSGLMQSWSTNHRGDPKVPVLNRNLPFLDETNINGNVDITLHVVPEDYDDPVDAINMRLKGTGLHVEKEVRNIKMLVITDEVIENENN